MLWNLFIHTGKILKLWCSSQASASAVCRQHACNHNVLIVFSTRGAEMYMHFYVSSSEVVHLHKPHIPMIRVGVVSDRSPIQIHRLWKKDLGRVVVHFVTSFQIRFETGERELHTLWERINHISGLCRREDPHKQRFMEELVSDSIDLYLNYGVHPRL